MNRRGLKLLVIAQSQVDYEIRSRPVGVLNVPGKQFVAQRSQRISKTLLVNDRQTKVESLQRRNRGRKRWNQVCTSAGIEKELQTLTGSRSDKAIEDDIQRNRFSEDESSAQKDFGHRAERKIVKVSTNLYFVSATDVRKVLDPLVAFLSTD